MASQSQPHFVQRLYSPSKGQSYDAPPSWRLSLHIYSIKTGSVTSTLGIEKSAFNPKTPDSYSRKTITKGCSTKTRTAWTQRRISRDRQQGGFRFFQRSGLNRATPSVDMDAVQSIDQSRFTVFTGWNCGGVPTQFKKDKEQKASGG